MWNKFATAVFLVVLLASCSTKKKITAVGNKNEVDVVVKSDSKKEAVQKFLSSNLQFTTFSGKAKSKIGFGKSSYDVTTNIRIEKDKKIWISISAILGLEVGRVLITPDSVQILNKFQGEYMAKPFSYLYQYASKDLTFENVQDLFLANLSTNLFNLDDLEIGQPDSIIELRGKKNELNYLYTINQQNRPNLFRLEQISKGQKLEANYTTYADNAGQLFPMGLDLLISGGVTSITANINYSRVSFNEAIEMPFTISNKYKVIN
ncbi:DUF4292 domain-containing protein [Sphingobacterium sp. SRCM116780]|uniref:DUF4292 domain-containing protein n=1 Tax=Sphingobacterium sp. SRCM116780 TaxID=2907623 RepID=UPI001F260601|nr:DUF4292 domain-containing protein [Sphingobacterium sp. SRCM116780]UIR54975.1 DUF4292 domain-containing protein [Sphingobacterium sp. SRCM116780]